MAFKNIEEYKSYIDSLTLDNLVDIQHHINGEVHPDRYDAVLARIEYVRENGNPNNPGNIAEKKPLPPTKSLPTFNIIKNTLANTLQNLLGIAKVTIIPFLFILLLSYIELNYFGASGKGVVFGFDILTTTVYIMLVIPCHRFILLGDNVSQKFGVSLPGAREIRFFGWVILVGFLSKIATVIPVFIGIKMGVKPSDTFILLSLIPGIYIAARFSLIFPAVAVDKRPTAIWAWQQSRNNGLRLTLLLALPVVLTYLITENIDNVQSVWMLVLALFIIFLVIIIGIIMISLSYKELVLENNKKINESE